MKFKTNFFENNLIFTHNMITQNINFSNEIILFLNIVTRSVDYDEKGT